MKSLKKIIATVLVAVMVACGCAAACAQQKALTAEEAKEIALDFAGLKADQVTFTKVKPDRDDGRMVYEIEFVYNGIEYEMDVDQLTGRITDFDKDYFHGHDRDDDDRDDFFDFD